MQSQTNAYACMIKESTQKVLRRMCLDYSKCNSSTIKWGKYHPLTESQ